MQRRKKKQIQKLNLIPIMDAIFIFIFFLLMSAQFIDIFILGSDLPVVSELDQPPPKEPLSLTLEISPQKIIVKTGLNGRVYRTIAGKPDGSYEYEKLHKLVIDLKSKNLKESSVTLKPSSKVQYKRLVEIMDEVRELKKEEPDFTEEKDEQTGKNKRELFNQIVFSNLMG